MPAPEPGQVYAGRLDGTGLRLALVCSRFNKLVTERLLAGALDGLTRHGVDASAIDVAWVPGAVEIPIAVARLADSGRYDALIALGAVIRGDTSHYDVVVSQCANGVARAALDSGLPVIFGVLTTDTLEQALERAGAKAGNKGFDAAEAAIEMADLLRQIPQ
ncbi:MAG: 6,7-dimethyl-8-ribityllumazine synthase [Acidimicrobiales bacterium]